MFLNRILTVPEIGQNKPKPPPQKSKSPHPSTLAAQLLPLFKVLRVIGRCPIELHNSMNKVEYIFNPKSLRNILFPFVSALCVITLLIFGILQFGVLGSQLFSPGGIWPKVDTRLILDPNSRLKLTSALVASAEFLSISHVVIEYFISWWTTPQLIKYLNEWNSIQSDFDNSLKTDNIDIKKFGRIFSIIYSLFISLMFMGLTLVSDVDFIDFPVYFVAHQLYSTGSTIAYATDDIKVVLIIKCVEGGFMQIHQAIQSTNSTDKFQLRMLQRLLLRVRSQAESCGQYLSISQLLSILLSIYFSSATIYICVMLIGQGNPVHYPLVGQMSFFATFSLLRILIKIRAGAGVTSAERNVAEIIKEKELMTMDEDCNREYHNIYNLLTSYPTEISLNYYVKLNNSLTLGIFGQVSTLFIVFMQLNVS